VREQFQGKQAAKGAVWYDGLTAAHRTSRSAVVRVVNLTNGKHVGCGSTIVAYDGGDYDHLQAAAEIGHGPERILVIQLEVVGDRRPDFVLAEEEAPSTQSALLSVHYLDPLAIRVPPVSTLGSPVSSSAHRPRILPTDVLMQRRIRRVPSFLAADHTAHTENITLVIG
jgi:hypothetical protein